MYSHHVRAHLAKYRYAAVSSIKFMVGTTLLAQKANLSSSIVCAGPLEVFAACSSLFCGLEQPVRAFITGGSLILAQPPGCIECSVSQDLPARMMRFLYPVLARYAFSRFRMPICDFLPSSLSALRADYATKHAEVFEGESLDLALLVGAIETSSRLRCRNRRLCSFLCNARDEAAGVDLTKTTEEGSCFPLQI